MIVALVSHYLTNKLIMRRPFPKRRSFNPRITCGIRHRFRCLSLTSGYVPTCYSAVRRSCTPEGALPLDLHVLGTPPAFILSQDQTLHKRRDKSRPTFSDLTQIRTDVEMHYSIFNERLKVQAACPIGGSGGGPALFPSCRYQGDFNDTRKQAPYKLTL